MADSAVDGLNVIRRRIATEGRILQFTSETLGIFDPTAALDAHQQNYRQLFTPAGVFDSLRFWRRPVPVPWRDVRNALLERGRLLNTPVNLFALHTRMLDGMTVAAGEPCDLSLLTELVVTNALQPLIISDLPVSAARTVARSQERRLRDLLAPGAKKLSLSHKVQSRHREFAEGRAIARQLRARIRGRATAREDFAQALLPFAGRLSTSQMTYVVTTLLTAVAGAPGSVAACLWYELVRRPAWQQRLAIELNAISVEQLCHGPVRAAPLTYRFVREVLRCWSFPLIARRRAIDDIAIGDVLLRPGDAYVQSSFVSHHDAEYWRDPDVFDPDRWLDSKTGQGAGVFVPFGWAPRGCIGASLGLSQLILFAHIACTRVVATNVNTDTLSMGLDGFAVPRNFEGTLQPIDDACG